MAFQFDINSHRRPPNPRSDRPSSRVQRASAFHRALDGYRPSKLRGAPELAEAMRVGRVLLKVEIERFGLPAFKILGASWAAEQLLAGRDADGVTLLLTEGLTDPASWARIVGQAA